MPNKVTFFECLRSIYYWLNQVNVLINTFSHLIFQQMDALANQTENNLHISQPCGKRSCLCEMSKKTNGAANPSDTSSNSTSNQTQTASVPPAKIAAFIQDDNYPVVSPKENGVTMNERINENEAVGDIVNGHVENEALDQSRGMDNMEGGCGSGGCGSGKGSCMSKRTMNGGSAPKTVVQKFDF